MFLEKECQKWPHWREEAHANAVAEDLERLEVLRKYLISGKKVTIAVVAGAAFLIDHEFKNGRFWDALPSMLRDMRRSFKVR